MLNGRVISQAVALVRQGLPKMTHAGMSDGWLVHLLELVPFLCGLGQFPEETRYATFAGGPAETKRSPMSKPNGLPKPCFKS